MGNIHTIHTRIRELRKRSGMSMQALATAAGVSSWQTVQQWEKENGTAPNRSRLAKVAEILNTSPEYLLTGQYSKTGTVIRMAQATQPQPYVHPDKLIAEAVALLEATDATGRTMALGAIKVALNGYIPAKANPSS